MGKMTGGNVNWRQDVRRSSRTAAIKFEFNREKRKRGRERGGEGHKDSCWSGPGLSRITNHSRSQTKPCQAETDTETEADTRHSAFLAQAVSLGNAYGGSGRTDGQIGGQTDVLFG